MKESVLAPVRVPGNLHQVLTRAFGRSVLRCVHGPEVAVTDWHHGQDNMRRRTVEFSIAVESVPPQIRRFFCGDTLRVTSRQTLSEDSDAWRIRHRLKLHFLGSEFFVIKPAFTLKHDSGFTTIEARVENHAILIPPLNSIAEKFMALNSQRELDAFGKCIQEEYNETTNPVATNPANTTNPVATNPANTKKLPRKPRDRFIDLPCF